MRFGPRRIYDDDPSPRHSSPRLSTRSLPPINNPRVLVYDAARGHFFLNGQMLPGISAVSGGGAGFMQPLRCRYRNEGPPPMETLYRLGPLHRHPTKPYLGQVMVMTPEDESKMHAANGGHRDGFLVHKALWNGTHGCIGTRDLQQLYQLENLRRKYGITHLQVIDSNQVGVPSAPFMNASARDYDRDDAPSYGPVSRYGASYGSRDYQRADGPAPREGYFFASLGNSQPSTSRYSDMMPRRGGGGGAFFAGLDRDDEPMDQRSSATGMGRFYQGYEGSERYPAMRSDI